VFAPRCPPPPPPPPQHTQSQSTSQQGFFSIIGFSNDNFRLCDLVWQPYEGVQQQGKEALQLALTASDGAWSDEKNDALSSYLAETLWASGALEAGAEPAAAVANGNGNGNGHGPSRRKGAAPPPLHEQVKEAIMRFDVAGGKAGAGAELALPAVGGLADIKAADLAEALVCKVKPPTADAAAAADGGASVALTGEDVAEAASAAIFQVEEAVAVATALKEEAVANQQALGKDYVFRVLELAEVSVGA
jgi:hypothetical protein